MAFKMVCIPSMGQIIPEILVSEIFELSTDFYFLLLQKTWESIITA